MNNTQTSVDTTFMEQDTEQQRALRILNHIKKQVGDTIVAVTISGSKCFFTTIEGDIFNLTLTKVDTEEDIIN